MLYEIARIEALLGVVRREANSLIDAHEPLERQLSYSMVYIHGLGQRFKVVPLGLIEVAELQLTLVAAQVEQILNQVVLLENDEAKSFILFDQSQSLLVLNRFVQVLDHIFLTVSEYVEVSIHLLLENVELVLVAHGIACFLECKVQLLPIKALLLLFDECIDIKFVLFVFLVFDVLIDVLFEVLD